MTKKKPLSPTSDNEKTESRAYDKILKENIKSYVLNFAQRELGFVIDSYEEIKDKLQTTLEREADYILKIRTRAGEDFILQLEFQSQDEPDMVLRMQEYHAILHKKYKIPIKQVVYFLGDTESKMRNRLEPQEIYRGFELKSFYKYSYQELIASQYAEEVVMAILADFGQEKAEAVINKILTRLAQLKHHKTALNKYVRQLITLARLRLNAGLVEIINHQIQKTNMGTIQIDYQNDFLFKKGEEKGLEEGLEKGEKKGEIKTSIKIALACLEEGFSIEKVAKLTGLSIKEVEKLKQEKDNF
ncbi:hypothetical protein [Hugenholtzia roseola]|uniref:hypothetical protein n=1 Tax=Hugenholtzia roseola TaxID=1002 RepID=UPI00040BEE8D|nr:hypothetical protein [Hugenholtzia roseola]